MDFSVGSKPLRPDTECSISAIQAALEKVVFVNYSIYYFILNINLAFRNYFPHRQQLWFEMLFIVQFYTKYFLNSAFQILHDVQQTAGLF